MEFKIIYLQRQQVHHLNGALTLRQVKKYATATYFITKKTEIHFLDGWKSWVYT